MGTATLSDRLLAVLGDPTGGDLVRRLAKASATQAELVSAVGCSQPAASRWITELRAAGAVIEEPGPGRAVVLRLACRDEVLGLLLAADRLAEAVLTYQSELQAQRSAETRRLAMRPAADERADDAKA
jgi:DNA-binding transcriptional ArsR family regulator